jgi:hypothetical protein
MLLPLFCGAQEIALLDRHFKEPIQFTGSFTREALNSNFPVLPGRYRCCYPYNRNPVSRLRSGKPPEQGNRILQAGHSLFAILGRSSGIYSTQLVVLTTRSGNKGATWSC